MVQILPWLMPKLVDVVSVVEVVVDLVAAEVVLVVLQILAVDHITDPHKVVEVEDIMVHHKVGVAEVEGTMDQGVEEDSKDLVAEVDGGSFANTVVLLLYIIPQLAFAIIVL